MFAGAALTATPSAANAQSAAGTAPVIEVPCDSTKLPTAITNANAAGTATVRLARNCTYTISGPLTITGANNVTLLGGPSTTIKANPGIGPVLSVASANATLRVQGIFILGGTATNGGGILNQGHLVLNFTTISGNQTSNAGGGVMNAGMGSNALIAHSIIKANTAFNGGGIFNQGTLTLIESLVAGNHADNAGGGISTDGATAAVTNIIQSTIEKNTAKALGGGIVNFTGNGKTSLVRSLVQQNKANTAVANSGGGIFNGNGNGPDSVTLRRSIVRRNTPSNCDTPATAPIQGCLG